MMVALLLALELLLPAAQAPAPPPPPLTLAAAIAQARVSSPFRNSAQSLAEGAALAARLAGRPLNPLLEVRSENWGANRTALPLDVFVTATQTFELGGKRAARASVAGAQRDLAAAQLTLTDQQLAQRTVQLYVEALRARGHLQSLRASRDGLSTLIASVTRRVEEGYSAESDLLRFQAEASRVDIDIARAGLDLDRALATLTVVLGAPVAVAASQLVEPAAVPPPSPDAPAIAAAIARHPEVVAADARVQGARQSNRLERARSRPDPMVTAGYKRSGGFNTAVAAVLMAVPIFDGNDAAIARTAGETTAATAERDALARRLTADVTSMIEMARTLSAQSDRAVGELLNPAEGVRNAARATFREGTTDVLKLIDAERVYADVQRAALDLRLAALAATLEARIALGEESLP